MTYEEIKNEHKTPNIIGICTCCSHTILDNQLYVELESLYHFSCHNRKIQRESEAKYEQ